MLNSDKDTILDRLGYYQGETFDTPAQVREYLAEMNVELDTIGERYSDDDVAEVAEYAIEHRLHWTTEEARPIDNTTALAVELLAGVRLALEAQIYRLDEIEAALTATCPPVFSRLYQEIDGAKTSKELTDAVAQACNTYKVSSMQPIHQAGAAGWIQVAAAMSDTIPDIATLLWVAARRAPHVRK